MASVNSLLAGRFEGCVLTGIVAVAAGYGLIRRWQSRRVFEQLAADH